MQTSLLSKRANLMLNWILLFFFVFFLIPIYSKTVFVNRIYYKIEIISAEETGHQIYGNKGTNLEGFWNNFISTKISAEVSVHFSQSHQTLKTITFYLLQKSLVKNVVGGYQEEVYANLSLHQFFLLGYSLFSKLPFCTFESKSHL